MVYAPSFRKFAPSGVMVHATTAPGMREISMDMYGDEKFSEKMDSAPRPLHSQSGSNINVNMSIYRVKNNTLLPLHHGGCSREYRSNVPSRFTRSIAIIT